MARQHFGPFSIETPDEWALTTVVVTAPAEESAIAAKMPTTKAVQAFQRNLVCAREPVDAKTNAESYLKKQIADLKAAGVPRRDVGKAEKVVVGGLEGVINEHVITSEDGERIHQMQLIVIRDGVAHILVASHLDGATFEAARAEFRNMLLSFQ